MTNRWEAEVARGQSGRVREDLTLSPGRQNPGQIEGRKLEYADNISGITSPATLASRLQSVLDAMVTRINAIFSSLSRDVGIVAEAQQTAVETSAPPTADGELAAWDGTSGTKLKGTEWEYLHTLGGSEEYRLWGRHVGVAGDHGPKLIYALATREFAVGSALGGWVNLTSPVQVTANVTAVAPLARLEIKATSNSTFLLCSTSAVEKFKVDSSGNVTLDGTVDGVDIAALDAAAVKDGEAAGGALAGTYPSPTLAADAVDAITEIAAAIKVGTGSKLQTADAAAADGTTARFTADGKLEGDLPMANRIAYVSGNVTISGGVLTLPAVPSGYTGQVQWNIQVDPESGTTDELDSISGGLAGDFIHLNVRLAGNTITVKHATGLIHLDGAADKVLNNVRDSLLLRRQSTFSNQISFSDNA